MKRRAWWIVLLLCLSWPLALWAAEVDSLQAWQRIPVLENGRVMPLDSLARLRLREFSGRVKYQGQPAARWLARVLFTPELTRDDAVFLVNNPEVLEAAGLPASGRRRYSFNQLEPALPELARLAREAFHERGESPSAFDNEILGLYNHLTQYMKMAAGEGLDIFSVERALLGDLAQAYREGRQVDFDQAARHLAGEVASRLPQTPTTLELEVRYNRLEPFLRARILYILAFLVTLLSVALRGKWLYRMALLLIVIALMPHTYGIVARMLIMHRPPVTNLYSTFVFVGWVCVWMGLALEWFQRNRLGLITASAMGLAMLMVSSRFGGGDTMGVMVAVLDSNFWLATHVITIAIGFAGCCASGVLGHVYLLQALRLPPGSPALLETDRAVYGAQAFGLIFSFLGTMLGGIWADQSWGRFWGWDPKENGALVVVLWSAIIFHARLGRMIGARGFAVGAILGDVGVLLAWLGVNLLGVGLHSYGFTSGLAGGLAIVCTVEILFVLLAASFSRRAQALPGGS